VEKKNLCMCGCGAEVASKWKLGHAAKVACKTPEFREQARRRAKGHPGAVWTPEQRAKASRNAHCKGKYGPDHPKWTGRNTQYRGPEDEWNAARKQVLERADGKCARCGDEKRELVVHHLESPDDGVFWNNEISNLEALCRGCHVTLHNVERGEKGKE